MLANYARFAFGQPIARRERNALDRPEKAFRCVFPYMTHAMMPQIHRLDHLGKENRLRSASARRVYELEIHKIEVVRLYPLINVFTRTIRILTCNSEFAVLHAASDFTPDGCHPTNGEEINASGGCVKTIAKFDSCHNSFQSEPHETVATSL
jgi:hypothetical protein